MLHSTMLDDVGQTCWLRLNRPLIYTRVLHVAITNTGLLLFNVLHFIVGNSAIKSRVKFC